MSYEEKQKKSSLSVSHRNFLAFLFLYMSSHYFGALVNRPFTKWMFLIFNPN